MDNKEIIEVLKDLWKYEHSKYSEKKIRKALEKGIEALENQKTGHWIKLIEDYPLYDMRYKGCSICRTHYPTYEIRRFKYCPNCGAKMEDK